MGFLYFQRLFCSRVYNAWLFVCRYGQYRLSVSIPVDFYDKSKVKQPCESKTQNLTTYLSMIYLFFCYFIRVLDNCTKYSITQRFI